MKNNDNTDQDLKIPLNGVGATFGKAKHKSGWQAFIKAKAQGLKDNWNIIGANPDALDKKGKEDMAEPPPIGNYISLYFPHDDWQDNADKYAVDIRKESDEGYVWDLEVRTNISNVNVDLDFTDLKNTIENSSLSVDYKLVLVDPVLKTIQDLTENSLFEYPSGVNHSTKSLRLIIGTDDFVKENDLGVSNIPLWYERVPVIMEKALFGIPRKTVPIIRAKLGDAAGVFGAAYLALRALGDMEF